MKVLGVIPARGGSKGVPGKNIRRLGGRPLLAYTADAAAGATRLDAVIVSTDDEEIAAHGRALGLAVPFLRPPELAQDDTPTLPVIQHAVRFMEDETGPVDAVVLLQPTQPFREPGIVDRCVALLVDSGVDSVVTVFEVPTDFNPHWVYLEDGEGNLSLATGGTEPITRRQALPPAYCRSGSVYVVRRDVLMERGSLYGDAVRGVVTDATRAVNIDTLEDWARAEALLASQRG